MAFLNKNDIKNYSDIKSKVIDVWGGQVKIRVMSVGEAIDFDNYVQNVSDSDVGLYLIAQCCVDEEGNQIFDKRNDDDINILKGKSKESVILILDEIKALNRMQDKDVEELAKN